jgi:succinate-acetate transporter protein
MVETLKNETCVRVKNEICTPDAMGSMLLGWIAMIMGLAFLKVYAVGAAVLAIVLMAGVGLIIVAWAAFIKNDIFGTMTFGPLGIFAIAFDVMHWLPKWGLAPPVSGTESGMFLIFMGLFLGVAAIITLKMPVRLLTIVVTVAAIGLTHSGLSNIYPSDLIETTSGLNLVILGFLSTYLGVAITMNTITGKMTWPVLMAKKDQGKRAEPVSS